MKIKSFHYLFTLREALTAGTAVLIFLLCPVPAFNNIGKLAFQLFSSFLLPVIPAAVIRAFVKKHYLAAGAALVCFSTFYLAAGAAAQLKVQFEHGTLDYAQAFYYDRPLCVALSWAGFFFFFVLCAMLEKTDRTDHVRNKRDFLRMTRVSGAAFLVFYLFLMIWFFVVVRSGFDSAESSVNIKPFETLRFYLSKGYDYENFMYFFGNAALLMPLGFFAGILFPGKNRIIVLFPVIVSAAIELSQFFLMNGMADIDDVILNCSGYYAALMIKMLLDKLRFVLTQGVEKLF